MFLALRGPAPGERVHVDDALADEASATAARTCPAYLADVKSAATSSTRIRSLTALSTRRWRICWYSGEPYHCFAVCMSGNSINTTEPGQAPSTTSSGAPSASHFPP